LICLDGFPEHLRNQNSENKDLICLDGLFGHLRTRTAKIKNLICIGGASEGLLKLEQQKWNRGREIQISENGIKKDSPKAVF